MERILKDRFLMKFRKKENSKITYDTNIEGFYKFITKEKNFNTDIELVKSLSFDDVENYFYFLEDNGYKKSTINLKIIVIEEFFNYAIDREIITSNYAKTVEKYSLSEIKEDKSEKYIPTIKEIEKIIKASYSREANRKNEAFNNARDRFLASLLSSTGMRIEEALGIKMEDIEYIGNNAYMINIDGKRVKNGIDKRLPIPSSLMKYFEEYKLQRMIMNEKFNSDLLFFSYRGKKLSSNALNNSWERLCDRANINNHITNHCFRHFLSNYLQSKGYDIGLIYKVMGWKEHGIITVYSKKANDKSYDNLKLEMCNILG